MNGIKKIYRQFREEKQAKQSFMLQTESQINEKIRFYNLWKEEFRNVWFYRFVNSRHLLDSSKKRIAFYSVFGPKKVLKYDTNNIRCFFTAENVHAFNSKDYADLFLADNRVGLSMAFDFFEDEKYLRMPTWVLRFFEPEADYEEIKRRCKELSKSGGIDGRVNYASLIASWDPTGLRQEIFDELSKSGRVDCPGKWNHNDDSLLMNYSDNKKAYLKTYRYNVCPENSNAYGYVTEKLFDAIDAGCVPIYWGSYNKPELEILNQEAILFWDFKGDNEAVVSMISDFENNPKEYDSFASQDRLLPDAAEKVFSMYEQLENKLIRLIKP